MNTIPHADIIRAILDGKVVQIERSTGWEDVEPRAFNIGWIAGYPDGKFRVKPEPVVRWIPVFEGAGYCHERPLRTDLNPDCAQLFRAEFIDGRCVSVTLEDA